MNHKETGSLIQNNKKHRTWSLTGVNGKKPNMKKPRQDVGAFLYLNNADRKKLLLTHLHGVNTINSSLYFWFIILQFLFNHTDQYSRINKFNGMILKISLIMIAISMTACSSLSGSFANRSNQLSSGLQNAYSVAPNTANRLSPMIVQSAERYDVSPTLLAALIRQESN
jgi:hypothetical protein